MRDRCEPTPEEMKRIEAAVRKREGLGVPSTTAEFLARLEARRKKAAEERAAAERAPDDEPAPG